MTSTAAVLITAMHVLWRAAVPGVAACVVFWLDYSGWLILLAILLTS